MGNKISFDSKKNFPATQNSSIDVKADSPIVTTAHSTSTSMSRIDKQSDKDSIVLNSVAAEHWQPQYYHMMRPDARLDNLRRFHNIKESPYPLPVDIEEQDRLEIQHLILAHCFGRLFNMPIEETISKPGARILDVGCGPGSWARDVATKYPLCEVYAVDMANTLFNGVEILPNTFFVEGNILNGLPFPDNYFDAVFQRYLIFGIPKDKWDFAISELRRVTKPEGFIECIEPNGQLENLGPHGTKLIEG
ncbi:hypothetical protein HK096_007828, partial [Nowakowskiella sp. JEL0078]